MKTDEIDASKLEKGITKNQLEILLKTPKSFISLFKKEKNKGGCRFYPSPLSGIYLLVAEPYCGHFKNLNQIVYVGTSFNFKVLWENHPKTAMFEKLDQLLIKAYNYKRDNNPRKNALWLYTCTNPFVSNNQRYEMECYLISAIKPLLNESITLSSVIKSLPMALDVRVEEIEECPL